MKKIIAIAVAIVVVLGAAFYLVTQPRSTKTTGHSQAGTSMSQKSSSAKSSESSSSSENSSSSSSQASSTAPAGNNAGNSDNASNPQPSDPQSSLSQSFPASDSNSPDNNSTQLQGQGHAVHNEQDAIDVVASAQNYNTGLEYEASQDQQYSGAFDVEMLVKAYREAGGDGAAGVYRVYPDGRYVYIS